MPALPNLTIMYLLEFAVEPCISQEKEWSCIITKHVYAISYLSPLGGVPEGRSTSFLPWNSTIVQLESLLSLVIERLRVEILAKTVHVVQYQNGTFMLQCQIKKYYKFFTYHWHFNGGRRRGCSHCNKTCENWMHSKVQIVRSSIIEWKVLLSSKKTEESKAPPHWIRLSTVIVACLSIFFTTCFPQNSATLQ